MNSRKLADEVNRLFDEMITSRWQQPGEGTAPRDGTEWVLEIPLGGADVREVNVTSEARTVVVHVHLARGEESVSQWRHSIVLPHGALLDGVTTRTEGGVLRIEVRARADAPKGRVER